METNREGEREEGGKEGVGENRRVCDWRWVHFQQDVSEEGRRKAAVDYRFEQV